MELTFTQHKPRLVRHYDVTPNAPMKITP